MVQPITYLPTAILSPGTTDGPGSYYHIVQRSKQAPPYVSPARFYQAKINVDSAVKVGATTSFGGQAKANATTGDVGLMPFMQGNKYAAPAISMANNMARAKLLESLGAAAGHAVNLAQRKQAMEMIGNRAYQLLRFARALKRFDLVTAAEELGLSRKHPRVRKINGKWYRYSGPHVPERHTTSKQFANLWLEFHFGWIPIVRDVYASAEILSQPLPGGYFSSKDFGNLPPQKFHAKESGTQNGSTRYPTKWMRTLEGMVFAKAGAELYVVDANAYLANRMGLNNPAIVLYDLIPFSFVANWFVNLEMFINSYTDLCGVEVRNGWYAWFCTASATYDTETVDKQTGKITSKVTVAKSGSWFRRTLGMADVELGFFPIKTPSNTRAATAISLLVQLLPKK